MNGIKSIIKGAFVLGSAMLATACIVEPREAYYDHDHHRYYHEHTWHECGEHNDFCR